MPCNSIICFRENCRFNSGFCCEAEVIEISDTGCLDFEEIDIYKDVEGFSRDRQAD